VLRSENEARSIFPEQIEEAGDDGASSYTIPESSV
jgi:hypothetical protein